jgi:voltage-gated potassium channel
MEPQQEPIALDEETSSPAAGPAPRGPKAFLHRYLEETPTAAGPRVVQLFVMLVIVLSVAAIVLGTVNIEENGKQVLVDGMPLTLEERYGSFFGKIEWFCVAVFTVEYLLRLWSVTVDPRFSRPIAGRFRFAMTFMALVDLLSILPFYLEVAGLFRASGFLAVRAMRLIRLFRIFKLGHYSQAVRTLGRVFFAKKADLGVTVFLIAVCLVLLSTVVYHAEVAAQPDKFSSIPATFWWGIVTLTTIGYGDISPVTPLGKIAAGVGCIFGVAIVALPAAIIGSAYIEELQKKRAQRRCPHCGKEIES